ncbi:alpha/beta hydrolase [Chitinimonas arctica]|uniref:Alpha/beta hydrolase n=1 Tax=Chitinimonas arctica TaxID=2594795 RepID=A0A516SA63_9NEIS|nr:alpha/beta hydrolase [Chitinimonas arctica]QDQ25039.1 alpha/beta hydrolase [Chitinimonas arctica]
MPLIIHPGWQDSGPAHWQSRWQATLPDAQRLVQADWHQPDLADWVATLDSKLAALAEPALLVCHSLGCLTLLHWAIRHPEHHARLGAALLVAPADVERSDAPTEIRGFAPIPRLRLPFPVTVVASDDDPFCRIERSRQFAEDWGAELVTLRQAGHINADSGFGAWPEGLALLTALRERQTQAKEAIHG